VNEYLRKTVHLSALLVPALSEITSKSVVLITLSILMLVYMLEEVLRLRGVSLPFMTPFTLRMSRPEERASFIVRPIYLALGIILTLIVYPSVIAYASICIGAIGDPVAAIVGSTYGSRRIIRRKTIEGFLAGLGASFLAASLLVSPFLALIGAIGGMLMELLDVPDDNLTMPIVAGALMILLTLVLHS
jgi:dolichol kinase